MSTEPPDPYYNPIFMQAWIVLSAIVGIILLGTFFLGQHLLHAGQIVWDLIRWLASPII